MGYEVTIKRLELSAVIDLKGEASAIKNWVGEGALPVFPELANTATCNDGLALYWIGHEHCLLRSDIKREDELLNLMRLDTLPAELSIVLVSDTLQFFEVTGPDASEIISIASTIDHHPSIFPENGVSYTNIFGLKGLLLRRSDGFEIAIERSYGDMIEDCLSRATTFTKPSL